ncbi:DUF6602 domain-containing protein, partial [Mycobacterium intracellulare]|uniref:DUF6602 domain-containing protein n=1 Tax=Mycobacterium intracellulare TaxID=1767 RepID=UPI002E78DCF6
MLIAAFGSAHPRRSALARPRWRINHQYGACTPCLAKRPSRGHQRRILAGPSQARRAREHTTTRPPLRGAVSSLVTQMDSPQYEIGTRKYLLLERDIDGETYSNETDLVIFHPSYPRELRERSEVLVAGVVAAFSVKSSLDAQVLQDAIAEARLVRDGFAERQGLIVGELVSPLIYGVLTHTHDLSASTTRAAVTNALLAGANGEEVPRRQLD